MFKKTKSTGWRHYSERYLPKICRHKCHNHYQRKNFPDVKAQIEAGSSLNFEIAWSQISLPVLSSSVRDVAYLLLHNKLPTKESLHRVN